MLVEHEIEIRVRYQETDAQGHVHHANYLTYFEAARTEQLRASGVSYRELEASGSMLVVSEANCRYFLPAHYDDLLTIKVRTTRAKGARIEHHYQVLRGEELLAEGHTRLACLDPRGKVSRIPDCLLSDSQQSTS